MSFPSVLYLLYKKSPPLSIFYQIAHGRNRMVDLISGYAITFDLRGLYGLMTFRPMSGSRALGRTVISGHTLRFKILFLMSLITGEMLKIFTFCL